MIFPVDRFLLPKPLVWRALLLLAIVWLLSFSEALQRLDWFVYDTFISLKKTVPDNEIVIVTIDEKSLQALGHWPWSREIHAELINRLTQAGNNIVLLDVLFAEPESHNPLADELLASAIATHGSVILPVVPASDPVTKRLYTIEPLTAFRAGATLGHADIELDRDGVARRVFLYAGINTPQWPAMGLALLHKARHHADNHPATNSDVKSLQNIGRWIRSQETLIPYAGPPGTFQQFSYAQVFYDASLLKQLENKIILVGVTATGLGSRFATPVSSDSHQPMSGVEWHANVFEMLRHDRMVYPVSRTVSSSISVVWVLAMLILAVLLSSFFSLPLLLAMLAGSLAIVGVILNWLQIWIPPAPALLGMLAIYPLWNWQRFNEYMRSLFAVNVYADTALESVNDGVITTDINNRIVTVNSSMERILGIKQKLLLGKSLQQALKLKVAGKTDVEELGNNSFISDSPDKLATQGSLETATGQKRMVRLTRQPIHNEQNNLMGFVVSINDMTDNVELTQKVTHLGNYDLLTGLPNRLLLLDQFDELELAAKARGEGIIILFMALDNFKKINNALGHRAGDVLLRKVAQRIQEIPNHSNYLARWSGDEFVALVSCQQTSTGVAMQLAQRLLEVIRQPFSVVDQDVFVTASIGVSFYPQNGDESETLLEHAATAMYHSKHAGGDNFSFYSPELSVVWTRDRLAFEKELRTALDNDQLQVFYQPIVDVRQQNLLRIEALVRWSHPERGFLTPGDFVPFAEQIGVIEQLGEKVLLAACLTAHNLSQSLDRSICISVNVNPRQLLFGGFVQVVSHALQQTGLPASSLILEITEDAIVNNIPLAREVLGKIKKLGVAIALDDFGTGYSSLSLLRDLPIDTLKIDKSFIRALGQNSHDLMITQAIIGLGENLNLAIIAEGVETKQQMQILHDHHCHLQQGYYFSRPIPYPALIKWIHNPTYTHL